MRNKFIQVFFLSCLMICSSCVEDSSTGLINEVNDVRIEGLMSEYRVMLYENLKITPEISASLSSKQLSYLWYLTTPTSSYEADTLSFEKDLDIVFTPDIANPGEKIELTYKVTDLESGVFYTKKAKLDLMTQYTKGTLVLCKNSENSALHFLNKTDINNPVLLENCYRSANEGNAPGENPVGVFAINPSDSRPQMREVMLCCNDQRGGAFLNPNTLRDHRTMAEAIQYKPEETYSVSAFIKTSLIDYLLVNGQVCKRAANMGNMMWEVPMVSVDGEKSYSVVPPEMNFAGIYYFYDQKYGRLLGHDQWNKGALKRVGNNQNDNTYFDINNIGTDMTYLCGGNLVLVNNHWIAFRNKADQSVWVYTFMLETKEGQKRIISKSKTKITSSIAANAFSAHSFSSLKNISGILFYATKDGLYGLDINSISGDKNCEIKLVDGNESGFEFTGFEMDKYKVERLENGLVTIKDELLIKAYIKDLSLTQKQGGFAEYQLSMTGGLKALYVTHRSGFCDRVVDLEEKYN